MNQLSPMRQRILDYVTAFTRENGYPPTVREICDAVGLRSPSTVHSHLKILQEGGFLEKSDHKTRALSVRGGAGAAFRSVPILGTVTAGVPILAQEDTLGYVPYDGPEQGEMFALRVRGESMIGAGILDGDIVLVRRQNTALSGQIVVALLEDEATVKRLRLAPDGVWLMPENPAFSPIDGRECMILGLVVSLYRPRV
ncbi:MAG: transcriptional repressor LexA [Clostridia bacterium]|nr:transcriptional repressor LexA [Clostridia bacterium]MDD7672809.1 transcriptional repressor LexA [Clostridia bacterium]MDY2930454.1 transcriptional repressor LexA [Clostridiaceae bacterium]